MVDKFKVGTVLSVCTTHVENPHLFFVMKTEDKSDLEHIKLRLKEAISRSADPDADFPRVLGYKCTDLGPIRVVASKTKDGNFKLFAIDHGCEIDKVSISELFEVSSSLQKYPPLAIRCRLHECQPRNSEWTIKNIEAMKFFLKEQPLRMTIMKVLPDGSLSVHLQDGEHTVSHRLVASQNACMYNCA